MQLRTYLNGQPRGAVARLAAEIGAHRVLVSQWAADDGRPVPIEHCPAIERATDGAVTRRELRPRDWHRIWPELVTDEHPAPIATEAAA
jgi:DNA-binding transcriptional regulator YdaS (Cro superfamily)